MFAVSERAAGLATCLRAELSEDSKRYDVSDRKNWNLVLASRVKTLQARRTRAALHLEGTGEEQLTWNTFLQDVPAFSERTGIRAIFDELVTQVREVCGDVSSPELFAGVHIFYQTLASLNESHLVYSRRDGPKKDLESYFGPIEQKSYNSIKTCVAQLADWKSQAQAQVGGAADTPLNNSALFSLTLHANVFSVLI